MELTEDRVNHEDGESLLKFALTDQEWNQIIENQKIVAAIIQYHKDTTGMSWYATDEYSNTINGIIQDAIGKDITDLAK